MRARPRRPPGCTATLELQTEPTTGSNRCSRGFRGKLSASEIALPAEILARRRFSGQKNSETPRCSAAVFCCSCPGKSNRDEALSRKQFERADDETHLLQR